MFLPRILSITLALFTFAQTAWAGEVTLKSTSSSVELIGQLKSFENGVYVIETDLGELEVDARTVTCTGASCPVIESLASEITVAGDPSLINRLLVPLLESYSFSLDAEIETTLGADTPSNLKIIAKDGQEFANIAIQQEAVSSAKNTLIIKTGVFDSTSDTNGKTRVIPLAADALVAITSDFNAVKSISQNALRRVLAGTTTNWKDLGGPDAGINLYLPKQSSGMVKVAETMGYDLSSAGNATRFDTPEELSKAAANDPYGLGITNYANIRTAKALPIIGNCGAVARSTAFNISSGSYPAAFYYYLEADLESLPIFAREFISYLGDATARTMIDRQGFTSLSVFENGLENQGNRIVYGLLSTAKTVPADQFRTMLETLNGARQLSAVFRSDASNADLSPRSSAALDGLISELLLGRFADQTLIVAGFTGAKGNADENTDKSKLAAQRIADYIKQADSSGLLADLQIEVQGFGEASPLACEETSQGIAINNRVEIWVKDTP
jgi:phosphate transport system substrate-binding protein